MKLKEALLEIKRLKGTGSNFSTSNTNSLAAPVFTYSFDQNLFTNYMLSVDELHKAAKSNTASDVLIAMKSIVMNVRKISESADNFEVELRAFKGKINQEEFESLRVFRNDVSSNLSNLITSAKQGATSPSKTTLANMDSASTTLTNSIQWIKDKTKDKNGGSSAAVSASASKLNSVNSARGFEGSVNSNRGFEGSVNSARGLEGSVNSARSFEKSMNSNAISPSLESVKVG